MEILFEHMLTEVQNQFPFLAITPLKPLAIGSGSLISACLLNNYDKQEVDEFIQCFFARREYKLALLNTYQADQTRFDVYGNPTNTSVNENEILGLSRHGMFKNTTGLLPAAKKLVKSQRKYIQRRHQQLKHNVYKLKVYGFSDSFIISRLGQRTEPLLKAYKEVKPKIKKKELHQAKAMQQQTSHLSKKELKLFQRELFKQGLPVPVILTASNFYEPVLFELIQPELSKPCNTAAA